MSTGEWAGFSEEDIKRMQRNNLKVEERAEMKAQLKEAKFAPSKSISHRKRNAHSTRSGYVPLTASISTEQMLCKSVPQECSGINSSIGSTRTVVNYENKCEEIVQHGTPERVPQRLPQQTLQTDTSEKYPEQNGQPELVNSVLQETSVADTDSLSESKKETGSSDKDENKSSEQRKNVIALEQFEQWQKQMEQDNAKYKALLSKAIEDRKKKTQAEAKKLVKIQEELNHLDSMLSVDVSILRDQIETASLAFSEAQKRYQKAEKEFVAAKLELFQKMEHKEQLTEYLCAIIEQNEMRKACKLAELMQKLEMESFMEECKVNGMGPILSNLCVLNDTAYKYCSTIKPPVIKQKNQPYPKISHKTDDNQKVDGSEQTDVNTQECGLEVSSSQPEKLPSTEMDTEQNTECVEEKEKSVKCDDTSEVTPEDVSVNDNKEPQVKDLEP